MKKILLVLSVVLGCAIFTACTETTDCSCTYGNETYQYYDWAGSCSDIMFDAKKAEFGNNPFSCVEI
jgi:hypothetical protein